MFYRLSLLIAVYGSGSQGSSCRKSRSSAISLVGPRGLLLCYVAMILTSANCSIEDRAIINNLCLENISPVVNLQSCKQNGV